MNIKSKQRLVGWTPLTDLENKTPSFGDIAIHSSSYQSLSITLPYEEGELRIEFKDARFFMTSWDGDPNPILSLEEAASRPSDLLKIEASRWLSSAHFSLDIESSFQSSDKPWEHFCIVARERSLHVAARDDIEALWVSE